MSGIVQTLDCSAARPEAAGVRTPATCRTARSSSREAGCETKQSQHSVIVPWAETIYYERQQNGYHGGATPQEMVCPLVILTEVDLTEDSAYSGLLRLRVPEAGMVVVAPR